MKDSWAWFVYIFSVTIHAFKAGYLVEYTLHAVDTALDVDLLVGNM